MQQQLVLSLPVTDSYLELSPVRHPLYYVSRLGSGTRIQTLQGVSPTISHESGGRKLISSESFRMTSPNSAIWPVSRASHSAVVILPTRSFITKCPGRRRALMLAWTHPRVFILCQKKSSSRGGGFGVQHTARWVIAQLNICAVSSGVDLERVK